MLDPDGRDAWVDTDDYSDWCQGDSPDGMHHPTRAGELRLWEERKVDAWVTEVERVLELRAIQTRLMKEMRK
jgi:hypothetical protein